MLTPVEHDEKAPSRSSLPLMTGRSTRSEAITLHQIVESDPKAYGSVDLWSFELLEVGRRLPCNNVTTFLHYLCSRGTRGASIATSSDNDPRAAIEVVLRGARADDGEVLWIDGPSLEGGEEHFGGIWVL